MPHWRWPHGWSTRRRVTKVGIRSCPGLKNAALPRQALVMLVATVVAGTVAMLAVPVVVAAIAGEVKAAQDAEVGIWLVSVKNVPNGPVTLGFGFSAENAAD